MLSARGTHLVLATIVLTVACGDSSLVTEPTPPPPDVDPIVFTQLWLEGTLTLNGEPFVGVSVTLNKPEGGPCASFGGFCPISFDKILAETITDNNGSWTLRNRVNCGRSFEVTLGALFYSVEDNVRTTWIAAVNRCTEDVQVFDHDIQDSP